MDRLQCMRDVNGEIDDAIDDLMQRRADCCGYDLPSSSSEEPTPGETFHILTENNDIELNEDGVYPVTENAY